MSKKPKLRIDFGLNVREKREKIGLSQEEFAHIADIHRTYVGTIERAEQSITIDNIEKIAKALKVEPDSLVKYRKEDKSTRVNKPALRRRKPLPSKDSK